MSDMTPSLEDYVEAIYLISRDKKVARVKDISKMLNVKRPSVTNAIKNLSSMDMVDHTPYSYITLTAKGEKLGREMFKRHEAIRDFFVDVLGIEENKASEAACRIEHGMDHEILDKLTPVAES